MKPTIALFSILFLFFNSLIYGQGVVTTNGLLKVNGNKIENKNGATYSVAGNSIFWSSFANDGGKFYVANASGGSDVVDHLATEWKAGIIRAAMGVEEADGATVQNKDPNFPNGLSRNPSGEGYYNNPAKEYAKIKTIIDAAIANDIYVVVDFHSHFAQLFKNDAIAFFTDIATTYGNNDHIIYEIFNEPIGTITNRANGADNQAFNRTTEEATWRDVIKPYAIDVINAIRAIDPDNLIIVGTPAFSQAVDVAADNPILTSDLDTNTVLPGAILNTAYTLHFYASTHGQSLRDRAQAALNKNIALVVTEWGSVEASGSGNLNLNETMTWLNFMNTNGISHMNWSVSDKGADTSSIIQGGFGIAGLLGNSLTPSGNLLRCVIEKWNAGEDYTNCTTDPTNTGGGDPTTSVDFPTGVGIKVTNGLSDAKSSGITSQIVDGNLVFGGVKSGEFIAYNLKSFSGFDLNKLYTLQAVVSSEVGGNVLKFEKNSGAVSLGSVSVPNTGKDNYTVISITGASFEMDTNGNISFAIVNTGGGEFKVESIYVAEDNDPALSIPTFSAVIANQINIYPIPVRSVLNVELPSKFGNVDYSLFDLKGVQIIKRTGLVNNQVNVENIANGIYLIQLFVNSETQMYKFIKD